MATQGEQIKGCLQGCFLLSCIFSSHHRQKLPGDLSSFASKQLLNRKVSFWYWRLFKLTSGTDLFESRTHKKINSKPSVCHLRNAWRCFLLQPVYLAEDRLRLQSGTNKSSSQISARQLSDGAEFLRRARPTLQGPRVSALFLALLFSSLFIMRVSLHLICQHRFSADGRTSGEARLGSDASVFCLRRSFHHTWALIEQPTFCSW